MLGGTAANANGVAIGPLNGISENEFIELTFNTTTDQLFYLKLSTIAWMEHLIYWF